MGNNTAERRHHEERIYEAKPGGKLLCFVIKDEGDGGEPDARRNGRAHRVHGDTQAARQADETFTLPAVEETVEDADQLRVALPRGKEVLGHGDSTGPTSASTG